MKSWVGSICEHRGTWERGILEGVGSSCGGRGGAEEGCCERWGEVLWVEVCVVGKTCRGGGIGEEGGPEGRGITSETDCWE